MLSQVLDVRQSGTYSDVGFELLLDSEQVVLHLALLVEGNLKNSNLFRHIHVKKTLFNEA